MPSPTDLLVNSANGDWLLTIFSILFLAVLGMSFYILRWAIHEMPKQWEAATDRIITKMCDMKNDQDKLIEYIHSHDAQAKSIKVDTEHILEKMK